MTESTPALQLSDVGEKLLRDRHASEKNFRRMGAAAVGIAFVALMVLLTSVATQAYGALWQTRITLPVAFSLDVLDPEGTHDPKALEVADYTLLVRRALKAQFPEVQGRLELRDLYGLLSTGAGHQLRRMVAEEQAHIGKTIPVALLASDEADMFVKGKIDPASAESTRKFSDRQMAWIRTLQEKGAVEQVFNTTFFTRGDSREPEQAGMLGAIVGSILTILTCLAVSFPLAVLTAAYLEEFAPQNKLTDAIEVNINNLAAVPSIIFGLLGLSIYLSVFGLPRSSALVGGLTLAMMTLPTIIITTRTALKAVPGSIRDAARGLGASPMQVVMHHTLPLALPGIMTGTILGISRALGETAPLLMIGMVAFVADVPQSIFDPATAMPVQIYLWADSPEPAFAERTAACILVLLLFLVAFNALAIYVRKKFERRW